jgi:hypothetical protein
MVDGKVRVQHGEPILPLLLGLFEVANGAALIAGLWTPAAGILSVVLSICEIFVFHDILCPAILLASMGAGLALVGPGAISIDAGLFGLKRIDISKLDGPPRD